MPAGAAAATLALQSCLRAEPLTCRPLTSSPTLRAALGSCMDRLHVLARHLQHPPAHPDAGPGGGDAGQRSTSPVVVIGGLVMDVEVWDIASVCQIAVGVPTTPLKRLH